MFSVQTPFSSDCPDSDKMAPKRIRSQSTSSLGEGPENGVSAEESLEKLLKESLSHEKRMLVNLGYEFHDIGAPLEVDFVFGYLISFSSLFTGQNTDNSLSKFPPQHWTYFVVELSCKDFCFFLLLAE